MVKKSYIFSGVTIGIILFSSVISFISVFTTLIIDPSSFLNLKNAFDTVNSILIALVFGLSFALMIIYFENLSNKRDLDENFFLLFLITVIAACLNKLPISNFRLLFATNGFHEVNMEFIKFLVIVLRSIITAMIIIAIYITGYILSKIFANKEKKLNVSK